MGIVDVLGDHAEGLVKNDRVIVYPCIGEGTCPACRIGEENLCNKPRSLGIYTNGGYADYVLVPDHRYLVKIGDDKCFAIRTLFAKYVLNVETSLLY